MGDDRPGYREIEARVAAMEERLAGIERALWELQDLLAARSAGDREAGSWSGAAPAQGAEPVAVAAWLDGAPVTADRRDWQAIDLAPREGAAPPADVAALGAPIAQEEAPESGAAASVAGAMLPGPAVTFAAGAGPDGAALLPGAEGPPQARVAAGRQRRTVAEIERAVSGAGLAWVGGLALVLGALFFLGLAISRGWIGPSARVAIGLVAGAAAAAGGYRLMTRRDPLVGGALVAVGLGVWNLALYAGTRLYGLIPLEIALLGVLAGSLAAAAIAVRRNSQVVAALGLVVALAAPYIYGGWPQTATVAFLAVVLAGTAAIALRRRWGWLPPIAFVLSAPQLLAWSFGDRPDPVTLSAIAAYWAIYAVSASGLARQASGSRGVILPSALMLLDTLFAVTLALPVMGPQQPSVSAGLWIAAAAAHGVLAAGFIRLTGDPYRYAALVTLLASALLACAAPAAFDGPAVPIAWALDGAALAAAGRAIRYPLLVPVGAAFGGLAGLHLLQWEYPFAEIAEDRTGNPPFGSLRAGALAVTLASLAVVGRLAGRGDLRSLLWIAGTGLVMATLPHELSGVMLLAAWCALAILSAAIFRLPRFANDLILSSATRGGVDASVIPVAGFATLAIGHLVAVDAPITRFALALERSGPAFRDDATGATALIVVAAAALAVVAPWRMLRTGAAAAIPLALGYLMPFELAAAGTAIAWAGFGAAAVAASRAFGAVPGALAASGIALLEGALLAAVIVIAPPARLFVNPAGEIAGAPLTWALAALAAVVAGLAMAARAARPGQVAAGLGAGAGAVLVYLLSVATVGVFQARVGPGVDGFAVARQAQVALSILWAVLGGAALALGLARFGALPRLFGLALLALAAAKVFFYDLSSLDAAYRVLSLLVVGALLLASSYVYRRGRERDEARLAATPPAAGGAPAPAAPGMDSSLLGIGSIIVVVVAAAALQFGGRPVPVAPHQPAATRAPRAVPSAIATTRPGRSLAPSRVVGARTGVASDFDGPRRAITYTTPGLSAVEGEGRLLLTGDHAAQWPSYLVPGVVDARRDAAIVVTVDFTSGGGVPALLLTAPDDAKAVIYIDGERSRWAWNSVARPDQRWPNVNWRMLPKEIGDIEVIELTLLDGLGRLAVNGVPVMGVLRLPAPSFHDDLRLSLGAFHVPPIEDAAFSVAFDGYAMYALPESAATVTPAPRPPGTSRPAAERLESALLEDAEPELTSNFDLDLVYPSRTPGFDIRTGNGMLILASTNPDHWPVHTVSGAIPAGRDAAVVAAIAGTTGGGIPAILLNGKDGAQMRVYVDREGKRWAAFPAKAGSPPKDPIQWRTMPEDLGPVTTIEASVIGGKINLALNGRKMSGLFDLPAAADSGPLTLQFGAYHPPGSPANYSVSFDGYGLFLAP